MSICNEIQQRIAKLNNNETLLNQTDLAHLNNCHECQKYQQACNEMNHAMSGMSDFDADDALLESTLSSILSVQQEVKKPHKLLNIQWASGLAASFMLISLIALFPYNSISEFDLVNQVNNSPLDIISEEGKKKSKQRKEALSEKREDNNSFEFIEVDVADEVSRKQRNIPKKPALPSSTMTLGDYSEPFGQGVTSMLSVAPETDSDAVIQSLGKEMLDEFARDTKKDMAGSRDLNEIGMVTNDDRQRQDYRIEEKSKLEKQSIQVAGVLKQASEIDEVVTYQLNARTYEDLSETELDEIKVVGSRISRSNHEESDELNDGFIVGKTSAKKNANLLDSEIIGFKGDQLAEQKRKRIVTSPKTQEQGAFDNPIYNIDTINQAKLFLSDLKSLDNVTYQNASGYWANTYLPGDSTMRLIEARLENNKGLNLSNGISQNIQPFDYPNNSALAVYLSSNVANVKNSEPTRMRLQVGIQASNRKGGHRSPMNIGLVFDLSKTTPEYANDMKELLMALLKAKQPGDNISLTVSGVTGVSGAVLIEPKDFQHGPIQVALNNLFSKQINKVTSELSLYQALKTASVRLQTNDDPSATLGSSVIMLFSANSINRLDDIESLIHQNAVDGITLSTISMDSINQDELKKLALAGQGHARILQSSQNSENEAKRVIDAELLASSRAVARALRLRIRLAKGVKLIEVLDSYNLNDKQSQRVRDAEQSLDKRLSKNLGITADRGEDEEGIQIVVPSFFAGDTHVVLLDVVVEKAGPIADVSMRYKDLLYLRNAVERQQLNLGNAIKPMGALQMNVIKNTLASHFAKQLKLASAYVKNGNKNQALTVLLSMQKLYQSMQVEFPVWNNDVEIQKDLDLIQQYISILNSSTVNNVQQNNYIIDSLQYISWRKHITQSQ